MTSPTCEIQRTKKERSKQERKVLDAATDLLSRIFSGRHLWTNSISNMLMFEPKPELTSTHSRTERKIRKRRQKRQKGEVEGGDGEERRNGVKHPSNFKASFYPICLEF